LRVFPSFWNFSHHVLIFRFSFLWRNSASTLSMPKIRSVEGSRGGAEQPRRLTAVRYVMRCLIRERTRKTTGKVKITAIALRNLVLAGLQLAPETARCLNNYRREYGPRGYVYVLIFQQILPQQTAETLGQVPVLCLSYPVFHITHPGGFSLEAWSASQTSHRRQPIRNCHQRTNYTRSRLTSYQDPRVNE
jgi:hypothetical protein